MGDADGSYDFEHLVPFLERLRLGWPLVVGTRLRGTIQRGTMPWLHRYIGNPVLTWLANLFFGTRLSDYHCGLHGLTPRPWRSLSLRTSGMEFASEMLIRATISGMPIFEVPPSRPRRQVEADPPIFGLGPTGGGTFGSSCCTAPGGSCCIRAWPWRRQACCSRQLCCVDP